MSARDPMHTPDPHESATSAPASSERPQSDAAWRASVAAGRELARWFDSPPGRYVLDWEMAQFDERVADIFGFHAVQLGFAQIDTLRANRMPLIIRAQEWRNGNGAHRPETPVHEPADCAARPDATDPGVVRMLAGMGRRTSLVVTQFEELPFASQSVDLVVLPHALELSPDPHQLLREAERVLVPEGKLLLTCFNPYSIWGLRHFVGRATGVRFLPRAGQFISLPRVKDWLKLLDFEVEGGKFGCYRPACRSQAWLARTAFLDPAGDRWWPVLGAVFMLQAVKRVRGMRLIGPAWKTRSQRAASMAPAAHRETETIM